LDFHRDLVHQWIEGTAKYRPRWQNSVVGQRWRDRREKHVSSQKADPLPEKDCAGPGPPRVHQSQAGPPGKAGSQKSPDFYLELTSDIQQAPSIGPKTTARLQAIGIAQVADFLNADPVETARRLKTRHLKARKLTNWQHQARLMCQVPGLQVCSAQILVGCNLTDPTQIAQMKPEDLLDWITPFCDTKEGERILRGDTPPGLGEVTRWIEWAGEYRILEAA
jgi:predicted flap endonuclease-1-like 5' DNA nuclease